MAPVCEWFAFCTRESSGVVEHPILGDVPTCERCANKLDLDLLRYCIQGHVITDPANKCHDYYLNLSPIDAP